jgi:hypothetical protein
MLVPNAPEHAQIIPTLIGVPVGVPPVLDEVPAVVGLLLALALVVDPAAEVAGAAAVVAVLLLLELPHAAATSAVTNNNGLIHRTCLRIPLPLCGVTGAVAADPRPDRANHRSPSDRS